jgi:hypothetical protein
MKNNLKLLTMLVFVILAFSIPGKTWGSDNANENPTTPSQAICPYHNLRQVCENALAQLDPSISPENSTRAIEQYGKYVLQQFGCVYEDSRFCAPPHISSELEHDLNALSLLYKQFTSISEPSIYTFKLKDLSNASMDPFNVDCQVEVRGILEQVQKHIGMLKRKVEHSSACLHPTHK